MKFILDNSFVLSFGECCSTSTVYENRENPIWRPAQFDLFSVATMQIKVFFVSHPLCFGMLIDPDFCSLNRDLSL